MTWFYISLAAVLLLFCIILLFFYRNEKEKSQARIKALKHQLTNNIAHEIRTPVASIRAYLETILEMPQLDEEHKQAFIQKAYDQSLRLSNLISDISLITKMEQGQTVLDKDLVYVHRIVEDIRSELNDKIRELGVSLQNDIPEDLCLKVNSALFYAIFRNLIENSLRYAGRDFQIEISCRKNSQTCQFLYYDTGKGLDEKELDRIFERFYRVKGHKNSEGSGLGLSIVKNAVEFHGGKIKVKLHKPQGLEYKFDIYNS